jgi:hypothetical protein
MIKTISKLFLSTLLVHVMCFSVIMSHIHAKDAVPLMAQPSGTTKLGSRDITAKALGDLHHHIDKAGVKNIHNDASTTAARTRELNPLHAEAGDDSLFGRINDFMLRLRMVASLCFQLV